MTENLTLYSLIFFLSIFQSIVGVGVLVLGTPILLLMNFDMINSISILLPVSIVTSFINLFLMNKKNNFFAKNDIKNQFFLFCLPGILLGTLLLRNFENYFNFNLLIAIIIISSVLIKIKFKLFLYKFFSQENKKIILSFLGVLQGITNTSGTLLVLFISSINKDEKDLSRYQTTYLYFFIALFQYIFVYFLFNELYSFAYYVLFIILLGSLTGNVIAKFIDKEIFSYLVYTLSFLSAIFLLFKSFSY